MKTFLEVSISASEQQREMLIPTMMEWGCEGFEETDTALLCYMSMDQWAPGRLASLKQELMTQLRHISLNADVQFREIQDRNWNEEWEKTIQPIEVGDRIVIKPSWAVYNAPHGKIVIQIDPKMSFGTGYHETTRLTIQLLEKYLKPGSRVLDVGTGTGILAIAAMKLGGSSAAGTDIDEWALENARENVEANGLSDTVEISGKSPGDFPTSEFDLLTANLTLNTNFELLEEFRKALRDNGTLLLSGLLNVDQKKMIQGLEENRFRILEEIFENEWIAIAAMKE